MMKQRILVGSVVMFFLVGCTSPRYAQQESQQPVGDDAPAMTTEDVIALVNEGVSDDAIIDRIKATDSYFELSTNDIIELKQAGLSEAVIREMVITADRARRQPSPRYYGYPYSRSIYEYWGYGYPNVWNPWFSTGLARMEHYSLRYNTFVLGGDRHSKADTLAMTKDDLLALVNEGVSDDLIIDQVKATNFVFELSPDDVIDLMDAGVSKRVIRVMRGTSLTAAPQMRLERSYYGSYYFPLGRTPWTWSRYYNNYYSTPMRR